VDMSCTNCGKALTYTDLYCGNCGTANIDPAFKMPAQRAGEGDQTVPAARPADWAVTAPAGSGTAAPATGLTQVRALAETAMSGDPAENTRNAGHLAYAITRGRGSLDPVLNTRLHLHILRHALVFAGLYAAIQTVALILSLLLAVAGLGLSSALSVLQVVTVGVTITLAALFWLLPVPALLAQWSLLAEHKSGAAGAVLPHIESALNKRATPLDSLKFRALAGHRNSLELRRSNYIGYISCFAHGRDLYVGWTFWLRLSPLRLLMMTVWRRIQDMAGRGDDIHQTLRFEPVRATVAAIHGCALQGIDAAAAELDPAAPCLLSTNNGGLEFEL
jgi:hypothetical protein